MQRQGSGGIGTALASLLLGEAVGADELDEGDGLERERVGAGAEVAFDGAGLVVGVAPGLEVVGRVVGPGAERADPITHG